MNVDRFKGKYRIPSSRADWWDYSNSGWYFITICSYNRENIFGKILNGTVALSETGVIVQQEWEKSFLMREELFCDEYIITPNHIHTILEIRNKPTDDNKIIVETHGRASLQGKDPHNEKTHNVERRNDQTPNVKTQIVQTHIVETHGRASLPIRTPKSISSFVAGFKSSATKRVNQFLFRPGHPVWQSRFYDHLIRTELEYKNIKNYIIENPSNWEKDKLFTE